MILLQGQGLARTFADEVLLKILPFIFKKIPACYRWAKWDWKIHAIKNVGWHRRTFSWRCVKEERSLDWLLRSIRCHPVSRTVWEEMVHLFEDVETLKKQAQKAAEQLGDPDLLSDPVAYELALKRYTSFKKN